MADRLNIPRPGSGDVLTGPDYQRCVDGAAREIGGFDSASDATGTYLGKGIKPNHVEIAHLDSTGIIGRLEDTVHYKDLEIFRCADPVRDEENKTTELETFDGTLKRRVYNLSAWGPQDIDPESPMTGGELGHMPIFRTSREDYLLGHVHDPPIELRIGGVVNDTGLGIGTDQFQDTVAAVNLSTEYRIGDPDQSGVEIVTPSSNEDEPSCVLRAGVWMFAARIEVTDFDPISPALICEPDRITLQAWCRKLGTSTWIPLRRFRRVMLPANPYTTGGDQLNIPWVSGYFYTGPTIFPLSQDDYEIGLWLNSEVNLATFDTIMSCIFLWRMDRNPWSYTIEWTDIA